MYEQITKNKKNELARKLLSTTKKETKSAFEKIADFSRKIRKDDDDDDDDVNVDDDNVDTAISTTIRSSSTPLVGDRSKFSPTSSLNDTKRFLLDLNINKNVEANESVVRSPSPTTEKVTFPDTITKLFPDAVKLEDNFKEIDNDSDDDSISEVQITVSELKDGNLPSHLQFFSSGKKMEKKLFENVAKNVGILSDSNQQFLEFLTLKFGENLLTKNKIQIHLDSGQIFQITKKLLKLYMIF